MPLQPGAVRWQAFTSLTRWQILLTLRHLPGRVESQPPRHIPHRARTTPESSVGVPRQQSEASGLLATTDTTAHVTGATITAALEVAMGEAGFASRVNLQLLTMVGCRCLRTSPHNCSSHCTRSFRRQAADGSSKDKVSADSANWRAFPLQSSHRHKHPALFCLVFFSSQTLYDVVVYSNRMCTRT
jgi:hypothetical protein